MELKSTMIEWWSGLDGPNGLTSAPMSYGLIAATVCRWWREGMFMHGKRMK